MATLTSHPTTGYHVKKQITEANCNHDLFLYRALFRNEGRLRDIKGRMGDNKGRLRDIKGRMRDIKGRMRDIKGRLEDNKGRLAAGLGP